MGALQPLQVITQDDLKLIEGFVEDFLEFSRNRAKKLRDIEKKVEKRFDEVAERLKTMKTKVKFRPYLKSKLLDLKSQESYFETSESFMLEASLKDSKTKLYLLVGIPLVLKYGDGVCSPGLAYIELFKSYPGQLPGRLLELLLPQNEFRGEAIIIFLIHTNAPPMDKEVKLIKMLLASNPTLLGTKDNVILLCNYYKGKLIISRTALRKEIDHSEQISCIDLFPHLNLGKLSRIVHTIALTTTDDKVIGFITVQKDEKGLTMRIDVPESEKQQNQNTAQ